MKLKLKPIALFVGLAVLIIASVIAVSAAPGAEGLGSEPANHLGADCGGLRMDEFYACEYGGWQPTPAAAPEELTTVGVNCGGLRSDEYYACLASGWRPAGDAPILAK